VTWNLAKLIELGALGIAAGAVNAAAGGGSLLTFPALVAFGLAPLTANLSNTVAQCPGYLAIVRGYRPELSGQGPRIRRLLPAGVIGGAGGVAALELAPAHTFRALAPALVLIACGMLMFQPRISRLLASRQRAEARGAPIYVAVAISCAYAAYFGAAAGVLLLAVLTIFIVEKIQRLNALSRLLILVVNSLAAVLFAILGPLSWPAVAVLAPTTMIGGRTGVNLVRRLGPKTLRALVLGIGIAAAAYLIATSW
jgi:hypothetical protein